MEGVAVGDAVAGGVAAGRVLAVPQAVARVAPQATTVMRRRGHGRPPRRRVDLSASMSRMPP